MKAASRAHIEGAVTQTNLIADQAGQAAVKDPHLVNAWGLAFNPNGPAWVAANGNGTAEVYDATGKTLLEVHIPTPAGVDPPSAPTGQIFNAANTTAFKGDLFIQVSEDGLVTAWQPSAQSNAVVRVDSSGKGAIYKGVAIATTKDGKPQLYATDFHNGNVVVWDSNYAPVTTTGGFKDTTIPAGFAPFNVRGVGSFVLVTYAKQDDAKEDDVKGPGNGFVNAFTADGVLVQRLLSNGTLDSPWAMVVQPDAGTDSIDLVVGNFGDGHINVHGLDLAADGSITAAHEGALTNTAGGGPIVIDGLWALEFGPDAGNFSGQDLFFTAGPNMENNGLFGKLSLGAGQP